ncbi:MAG: zeta toxin family protein [Polyangiales bacterium]
MNPLDQRPIIVAIAGPNGAGKSTFHAAHLRQTALRFVNADELARELSIDAYRAAEIAGDVRRDLVAARESFIFETVFSDPAQEKVRFLRDAAEQGYTVLLCFIGLDSAELSDERVALRSLEGGHDVPREKLFARYPRSLRNLAHALRELPFVRIYDNSEHEAPHRLLAALEQGSVVELRLPVPAWAEPALSERLPVEREFVIERVEREGAFAWLDLVQGVQRPLRVRAPLVELPAVGQHAFLSATLALTLARKRASKRPR